MSVFRRKVSGWMQNEKVVSTSSCASVESWVYENISGANHEDLVSFLQLERKIYSNYFTLKKKKTIVNIESLNGKKHELKKKHFPTLLKYCNLIGYRTPLISLFHLPTSFILYAIILFLLLQSYRHYTYLQIQPFEYCC